MKTYIVTWDVKRNHKEYANEMRVEAKNLKDAREQFELKYFNSRNVGNPPHPFHIKIKLLKNKDAIKLTKRYFVRFNNPVLNAWWEFRRDESAAFAYGNGTSVSIFRDDNFVGIVDTRYDHGVIKDFGKWCRDHLEAHLDPAYAHHIEER